MSFIVLVETEALMGELGSTVEWGSAGCGPKSNERCPFPF